MNLSVYTCIYHYSYPVKGFRGGHRDAAMLDASQPPVEQVPDEGNPCPCPEDEEFFVRPDAAGMEEARYTYVYTRIYTYILRYTSSY